MNHFLSASLALSLVSAATLSAQSVSRPFSVDLVLGYSNGWGGNYGSADGPGLELTVSPPHSSTWVTALTGGLRGAPRGDGCSPNPNCRTPSPVTAHIGLLGGLERVTNALTVRAALGPAFFGVDDGVPGGNGLGPIARVDLAVGFRHVAFVAVGQGGLIIRSGGALRQVAFMGGVRLR